MATAMDSTQLGDGQAANPDTISQAAVQQNSFDPAKFKADLLSEIRSMMADPRTVQSVKDKTLAEIKKDRGLKDYLTEIQNMRASGMTDEQIALEARLREIEQRVLSAPETQSSNGRQVVSPKNDAVFRVAESLGLDMNDPEVSLILSGPDDETGKITRMSEVFKRKLSSPPPNPALVAQPAGGSMTPMNPQQLEAQYKKEVLANRGNRAAIERLQAEYAEKGLNVNAVVFSV